MERKVIKRDLSFAEAWAHLLDGDSEIAHEGWDSQKSILISDGYIVMFNPRRNTLSTWHPDPIEMMDNNWMIVE